MDIRRRFLVPEIGRGYYLTSTNEWGNPTSNGESGKELYNYFYDIAAKLDSSYSLDPPQDVNVYINNIKIEFIFVEYAGQRAEISLFYNKVDYEWYALHSDGSLDYYYD